MARLPRSKRLEYIKQYGHYAVCRAALDDGLKHFTIKGKKGFIPYKVKSGIMIAPGEPICAEEDALEFFEGFKGFAKKKGHSITFFGGSHRLHSQAEKAGFDILKFGEEAVIDVQGFSIKGNKMLNVRRGLNRCTNLGVEVFEYHPEKKRDKKLEKGLEAVSSEWLATKPTPELGFLMGKLEMDQVEGRRFFVAALKKKPQGFLVLNPMPAANSWYADLLRRPADAPNGIMETLAVHALDQLKKEGSSKLYFGMVPFIGIDTEAEKNRKWNKIMAKFGTRIGFLYPVKNEHFFKNKFRPAWEPVYMVSYPSISTKMILAVVSVFMPGGFTGLLKYKITGK